MPKNNSAARRYTTAADAAARPAETVSETVPTRHEAPDVAELRRLAENATPGPWTFETPKRFEVHIDEFEFHIENVVAGNYELEDGGILKRRDRDYIAAASPDVVLGLLDDADTLIEWRDFSRAEIASLTDRLAHMTEACDNARAEVERLSGVVERVRGLHSPESFWQYDRDQEHSYPTQQDAADDSGCDCPYAPESTYLAHTAECLATITHFDVCSECARIEYADADRQAHGEFSGYAESLWPCPTRRAIGGEQS